MATKKQVRFMEKLMEERDLFCEEAVGVHDSLEARSVRCGMGDELGVQQASNFIEILLSLPKKPAPTEDERREAIEEYRRGEEKRREAINAWRRKKRARAAGAS